MDARGGDRLLLRRETMNTLRYTRTLIATSILGLLLAIGSVAYSQPSDAGPAIEAPVTASPVIGHESTLSVATPGDAPEMAQEAVLQELPAANPAKIDPGGTGDDVYRALEDGKWLVAFGGILMFLVWGLRMFLLMIEVRWAQGEMGGNIIAFGTAFLLAIGIALSAGQGLSVGLLSAAAGAGWLAKGQWSHAQAAKAKKAAAG